MTLLVISHYQHHPLQLFKDPVLPRDVVSSVAADAAANTLRNAAETQKGSQVNAGEEQTASPRKENKETLIPMKHLKTSACKQRAEEK
jgi:hypothetical protein